MNNKEFQEYLIKKLLKQAHYGRHSTSEFEFDHKSAGCVDVKVTFNVSDVDEQKLLEWIEKKECQ